MEELKEQQTKSKWYQRSLGIVAMLILFFPIGLFLMWKYAQWDKKVKWGVTGALVLFLVIGVATDDSDEQARNLSNPSPQAVTEAPTKTKPTDTPKPTKHEFDAEVRFNEAAFQITNKENSDWTDCRLELNSGIFKGGYIYKIAVIPQQDPLVIPFREFTKGDGTRFNSYDTKPKSLSISCDVDGISGFGYYAIN